MYLTIGNAIAYGLALLATGFFLGILAKPFKYQAKHKPNPLVLIREVLQYVELNMANYDHEAVRRLNDAATDAWIIADKAIKKEQ